MMLLWKSDGGGHFRAQRSLGVSGMAQLAVASLGEAGWDWNVWDSAGRLPQRYGFGDTLAEAITEAEAALADLIEQLGQSARA